MGLRWQGSAAHQIVLGNLLRAREGNDGVHEGFPLLGERVHRHRCGALDDGHGANRGLRGGHFELDGRSTGGQ